MIYLYLTSERNCYIILYDLKNRSLFLNHRVFGLESWTKSSFSKKGLEINKY